MVHRAPARRAGCLTSQPDNKHHHEQRRDHQHHPEDAGRGAVPAMNPSTRELFASTMGRANARERTARLDYFAYLTKKGDKTDTLDLMPSSVSRACLYCVVPGRGGARGALCTHAAPLASWLPDVCAISRASGDVDAMLKSIRVGRFRLTRPGSGSGSRSRRGLTAIGEDQEPRAGRFEADAPL